MASAVLIPAFAGLAGAIPLPNLRGPMAPNHGAVLSRGRLLTDAVGAFVLQLQNVVVGSRYRVEALSTGDTLAEGEAGDTLTSIPLPLYANGNPNTELRIKVRNASGTPAYKPFESQAVAQLGTVTVFVFQEPDE